MLEFIVLGEIPGTTLVMNFYSVLGLTVAVFGIAKIYLVFGRNKNLIKKARLAIFSQLLAK